MQDTPIIAIVDDDPSVRVATDSLVRSLGFVARTFASAGEFLSSHDVACAACVITDVTMPGMTGIELQSALAAQGYNMPVIFMTAFPQEQTRAQALDAGAVGFLTKPFDARRMIECLGKALGRRAGWEHGQ